MIKKTKILKSLPGDAQSEIEHYSPDERGEFREGVAIEFTDHQGHVWIGNFQPAGSAGHRLFRNGIAAVTAGGNCYLISDQKSKPRIVNSHCDGSVWSDLQVFPHAGKLHILLVGSGGYLVSINEMGSMVGSVHLPEPCENVQVETLTESQITGSYYEFNLKKSIPFRFRLPKLLESPS